MVMAARGNTELQFCSYDADPSVFRPEIEAISAFRRCRRAAGGKRATGGRSSSQTETSEKGQVV